MINFTSGLIRCVRPMDNNKNYVYIPTDNVAAITYDSKDPKNASNIHLKHPITICDGNSKVNKDSFKVSLPSDKVADIYMTALDNITIKGDGILI